LQHKFEPAQKPAAKDHPAKDTDIQAVRESVVTPGYDANLSPSPEPDKSPVTRTWQEFLNKIEQTLPFMFALLSKGKVIQTNTSEIIVELKNGSSFDKTRLERKKDELQDMCKKFLGKSLIIKILSENNNLTRNNKKKNEMKAKQASFNHPLVVEAQKIFNGEIIN
ncbi:MAG: DNA polymerase III subunit gamma/tau, partial [Desulfobacterales bacterium]|nr:DNA polymerase III subunit gamma/tau [Desulfobacterales bacterium]